MALRVDQQQAQLLVSRPPHVQADGVAGNVLFVNASVRAHAINAAAQVLYDLHPPTSAVAMDLLVQALIDVIIPSAAHVEDLAAQALVTGRASFYAANESMAVLFDYRELSPNLKRYEPVSDYLFPDLPGLSWDVIKRPTFSTAIAPHVSGREVRVSSYAYPLWTWEMSYEFLRAGAEEELQRLMGFFLERGGCYDTFLFQDPDEEHEVSEMLLGVGDTVQTRWTMVKRLGGFDEPCGYVDPISIRVFLTTGEITTEIDDGWSFISPNQLAFTVAVETGVEVRASYRWYYRVRFGEDAQDYSKFMYNLWELGSLTLQSVKP